MWNFPVRRASFCKWRCSVDKQNEAIYYQPQADSSAKAVRDMEMTGVWTAATCPRWGKAGYGLWPFQSKPTSM